MKKRRELTILCRNRKCRNPVEVIVTLDISFYRTNYRTKDREDIYKVSINVASDVENKRCKKCGRKIVVKGPLIGSIV